jgi:hypothetical protein
VISEDVKTVRYPSVRYPLSIATFSLLLIMGGGSTKQCGALDGGFHFHRKSLLPCQQLSLLESLMPDVLPPALPYKEGQDRNGTQAELGFCSEWSATTLPRRNKKFVVNFKNLTVYD